MSHQDLIVFSLWVGSLEKLLVILMGHFFYRLKKIFYPICFDSFYAYFLEERVSVGPRGLLPGHAEDDADGRQLVGNGGGLGLNGGRVLLVGRGGGVDGHLGLGDEGVDRPLELPLEGDGNSADKSEGQGDAESDDGLPQTVSLLQGNKETVRKGAEPFCSNQKSFNFLAS